MTESTNNSDHNHRIASLSEDVGRLVRIAGPRPTIPAENLARIQETLRPVWDQQVASHSSSRPRLLLAAVAALLILAIGVSLVTRTFLRGGALSYGTAARLEGTVTTWTEGKAAASKVIISGDSLETGQTLATAKEARAALQTTSGHSLRLDHDTRIVLLSEREVRLEQGAIYIDSGGENSQPEAMSVVTAIGTVTELGTQFEVRLSADTLTVRVREGQVEIGAEDLEFQTAGDEEVIVSGGVVSRHPISSFDLTFDWTQRIAPAWELDGSRLGAFLDWVVREGGYTLEYSDTALEQEASRYVLNGEIEDLDPSQALAVVLPVVELTHRLDEGILIISRLNGQSGS
jgi:hypothetical protein